MELLATIMVYVGLFFIGFLGASFVGFVYSNLRRIHDEATWYKRDPLDRGW